MTKIMKELWAKNENLLKKYLESLHKDTLGDYDYEDLLYHTLNYIFNSNDNDPKYEDLPKLDLNNITKIDNGDCQGTLLFIIPFNTYQPCEHEYLMTYVGYGSCSGYDTLQSIQEDLEYGWYSHDTIINDFMTICRDMVCNIIKPYNYGWRHDKLFVPVE